MKHTVITVTQRENGPMPTISLSYKKISPRSINVGNTLIVYYNNRINYYSITRADFIPAIGAGNHVFSITIVPTDAVYSDVVFIEVDNWF